MTTLVTRVMKARRETTCPLCRGPIHVSQPIARLISPPGWCHLRCVPHVARAMHAAVRGRLGS